MWVSFHYFLFYYNLIISFLIFFQRGPPLTSLLPSAPVSPGRVALHQVELFRVVGRVVLRTESLVEMSGTNFSENHVLEAAELQVDGQEVEEERRLDRDERQLGNEFSSKRFFRLNRFHFWTNKLLQILLQNNKFKNKQNKRKLKLKLKVVWRRRLKITRQKLKLESFWKLCTVAITGKSWPEKHMGWRGEGVNRTPVNFSKNLTLKIHQSTKSVHSYVIFYCMMNPLPIIL